MSVPGGCGGTFPTCPCVAYFGVWTVFDAHLRHVENVPPQPSRTDSETGVTGRARGWSWGGRLGGRRNAFRYIPPAPVRFRRRPGEKRNRAKRGECAARDPDAFPGPARDSRTAKRIRRPTLVALRPRRARPVTPTETRVSRPGDPYTGAGEPSSNKTDHGPTMLDEGGGACLLSRGSRTRAPCATVARRPPGVREYATPG